MEKILHTGFIFLLTGLLAFHFQSTVFASDNKNIKIDKEHITKISCFADNKDIDCAQHNYNKAIVEDMNPWENDENVEMKANSNSITQDNGDINNQEKELITKCSGQVKCKNISDTVTIIIEDKFNKIN